MKLWEKNEKDKRQKKKEEWRNMSTRTVQVHNLHMADSRGSWERAVTYPQANTTDWDFAKYIFLYIGQT